MENQSLIEKVLARIDELSPQLSDGVAALYNIQDFLVEATIQILNTAPLHAVPSVDFSKNPPIKNSDGSGSVNVPDGYLRLVEFRMKGWERPVNTTITIHNKLYTWQFNPVLRGGVSKPVVAINQGRLEYYSLPQGNDEHVVQSARCVVRIEPKEMPMELIDPLCWLAASFILNVKNEPTLAGYALKRYSELIIMLYGDDNNNT